MKRSRSQLNAISYAYSRKNKEKREKELSEFAKNNPEEFEKFKQAKYKTLRGYTSALERKEREKMANKVRITIGDAYYCDNGQYQANAVGDDGKYYYVRWDMRENVTDEQVANDESCACDWDKCACILDDGFGEVAVLDFDNLNSTAIIIPRL